MNIFCGKGEQNRKKPFLSGPVEIDCTPTCPLNVTIEFKSHYQKSRTEKTAVLILQYLDIIIYKTVNHWVLDIKNSNSSPTTNECIHPSTNAIGLLTTQPASLNRLILNYFGLGCNIAVVLALVFLCVQISCYYTINESTVLTFESVIFRPLFLLFRFSPFLAFSFL